ncbi:hypothetical protein ACFU7X_04165 [Streptomyces chartreusis]|uniref:hypothetical protein n=1 Tax=Streptomyces chartreusis TaxID=1969 RepID=UPI003690F196
MTRGDHGLGQVEATGPADCGPAVRLVDDLVVYGEVHRAVPPRELRLELLTDRRDTVLLGSATGQLDDIVGEEGHDLVEVRAGLVEGGDEITSGLGEVVRGSGNGL